MTFTKMNEQAAKEICYDWKYPGEYSFYDMTEDQEDLEDFLNPANWSRYFTIYDDSKLIAFFMYAKAQDAVYIGLGLKPALTGKGLGKMLVNDSILFLKEHLSLNSRSNIKIRLKVASFNQRAIKTYKNAGFIKIKEFIQKTNGGEYPFIEMELVEFPSQRI